MVSFRRKVRLAGAGFGVLHATQFITSSSSFLYAPLGVHSAIHRHQPPQRTVLSEVNCFIQCEVVSPQISLDSVQPYDARAPHPGNLLQFSDGGAVRIILASASSSSIMPKQRKTPQHINLSPTIMLIITRSHVSYRDILSH